MTNDLDIKEQVEKAAEIGIFYRRKREGEPLVLTSSEVAATELRKCYDQNEFELRMVTWAFCLNTKAEVIAAIRISDGKVFEAQLDLKRIMQAALLTNASRVITCNNHPSGKAQITNEYIKTAKHLKEVLNHIDVILEDHIILGINDHVSLADEGQL